jgi:hypothetical protein
MFLCMGGLGLKFNPQNDPGVEQRLIESPTAKAIADEPPGLICQF